ncbi:unnamed protein product [Blepharisma stoltei]|uniref:V-type proton ATPase subunit H n=1 Tax=Blepharisma stoltei TaxID=1481888 RepID=A0AAU9IUG1_9CILI|nr:unnamed protein product [Blepharisma stoltei]
MAVSRDRLMAYSISFIVHPEAYISLSIYIKPDIYSAESAGSIGRGLSEVYSSFMVNSLEAQRKRLLSDEAYTIYRALFSILDCINDDNLLSQSILTTLDGILVDDVSQSQVMSQLIGGKESFNILTTLIRYASTYKTAPIAVEAASHILAILLGEQIIKLRNSAGDYLNQASRLIDSLINQAMDNTLQLDAVTYCLMPLLKVESLRLEFLRIGGIRTVLLPLLEQKSGVPQPMYAAICCLWMVSFNEESIEYFIRSDYDLIPKIIKELKRTEKEKVIRVALGTLKNLSDAGESAIEIMIDSKLIEIIDNLSKRVLKDQDIVELVKGMGDTLERSVKILSSFEKWLKELERGDLVAGVTHTEAFWKENARHLENDSFGAVKKLVMLLHSENPTCIQLALNDLGEFARFHPYGKTVASKLGAKNRAMELMQHPNREVNQAALLCIQKLMIQNWQSIA